MLSRLLLRRRLHHHIKHSPPPPPIHLPLSHPTYQIWSSNTGLGKTLVSTGLAASFLLSPSSLSSWASVNSEFIYLKPIQTGFPSDSDSNFLFSKLSSLSLLRNLPLSSSSHFILNSSLAAAAKFRQSKTLSETLNPLSAGMVELGFCEEKRGSESENSDGSRVLKCKTLFAWEEAVSPHLVAEREEAMVEDSVVVEALGRCLREALESEKREGLEVFCVVETAGGVASPGPSGTLQCDLYRSVVINCYDSDCFICVIYLFYFERVIKCDALFMVSVVI